MARRRRTRGAGRGCVWLFVLGVLVGAGVLYLVFRDPRYGPGENPTERPATTAPQEPSSPAQPAAARYSEAPDMPSVPAEARDTEPVKDGEKHLPGHVALVI